MSARMTPTHAITGRCYCGATTIRATEAPHSVSYCHCIDCRRACGAPVAALAGFDGAAVTFSPDEGQLVSLVPGVERRFCARCGSPLSFRGDYIPDQIFVPISLLDQAAELEPQFHSYETQRLPWLHIADRTERFDRSSRSRLNGAREVAVER